MWNTQILLMAIALISMTPSAASSKLVIPCLNWTVSSELLIYLFIFIYSEVSRKFELDHIIGYNLFHDIQFS